MNKDEALARIIAGVSTFRRDVYPQQSGLYDSLKGSQHPLALLITCADSRIVPNLFTQTGPGEVFTERNPGNLVPKYGEFVGGVSAGIEFAMRALKVPLAIVCGHTDCGVMKALLHPEQAKGMPSVQDWMRHVLDVQHRVLRDHGGLPDAEKLRLITEFNVLAQVENLKTHQSVAERLAAGEIEIQGWVYDVGNASVSAANFETGKFELLT